jgi:hypothetical protein
MGRDDPRKTAITPAEALDRLTPIDFKPETWEEESGLKRVELMQSVLLITEMTHVKESKMVRHAVGNAIGIVPGSEE